MEQVKALELLKLNFSRVEEKFQSFFKNGAPRWPGENQDILQNHIKSLDSLPLNKLTFENLQVTDLPGEIVEELKQAFDAFKKGINYP